MAKADGGGYYGDEGGRYVADDEGRAGSEVARETHTGRRVRQLRAELDELKKTLEHPGLIDLDVGTVADALQRRDAIEYIIAETERRAREAEEQRRREAEERERALDELRAAVASDPALRREVERRNRDDKSAEIFRRARTRFGPLPGGFDDSLRSRL